MEENEFDMTAAQDEISRDLFGGEESVNTEVSPPEETGDVDLEVSFPEQAQEKDAQNTSAKDDSAKDDSAKDDSAKDPAAAAKPEVEVPAPRTWRAEAAAKWAELPKEVRDEILKREEDIFKGIESYKEAAQFGSNVDKIIAPYKDFLKQEGYDPLQQIDGLMRAQWVLAKGSDEQKSAVIQHLIKAYNIPMGGTSDADDYVDPQVKALRAELDAVKSTLTARERQEASTVKAQIQSEIDSFAADPNNPYFDEVANDIAVILRGGGATTLKEAYEKAIWQNPVTRAKEQARQAKEAEEKSKAEAAAKLAATKRAVSANVSSRTKSASTAAPVGTMEETLEATLREIQSRTK